MFESCTFVRFDGRSDSVQRREDGIRKKRIRAKPARCSVRSRNVVDSDDHASFDLQFTRGADIRIMEQRLVFHGIEGPSHSVKANMDREILVDCIDQLSLN